MGTDSNQNIIQNEERTSIQTDLEISCKEEEVCTEKTCEKPCLLHKIDNSLPYGIVDPSLLIINSNEEQKRSIKNMGAESDHLTKADLLNGAFLTNVEIHQFLEHLKIYLNSIDKSVNGLNDPSIHAFISKQLPRHEKFVEIILSRNNHWVCVAGGLNIDDEDVCLYDSFERKKIDSGLARAVADLVTLERLRKGYLKFRLQNTQKQKGHYCGYFALANATALCLDFDPEMLIFNEKELRKHVMDILFDGAPFSMFPYKIKSAPHETFIVNLNEMLDETIYNCCI